MIFGCFPVRVIIHGFCLGCQNFSLFGEKPDGDLFFLVIQGNFHVVGLFDRLIPVKNGYVRPRIKGTDQRMGIVLEVLFIQL